VLIPAIEMEKNTEINSGHFVRMLKYVNLRSLDTLVSFDIVSFFTNMSAEEFLHIGRTACLADRSCHGTAGNLF
jgi:hypothetical protein